MPPQHDAFGRPTEPSSDAAASSSASEAFAAAPAKSAARSERRPGGRDPRLPAWRLPYLLVLLLVGAGGVTLTLSAAADWADDQPSTHEFALERDPFGPRSLLRPDALTRSIDIALAEAEPGDRVANINARPTRVLVTLTDPRDQSRWVTINTAGDVQVTDLRSATYANSVPPARATVDPAPAVRALRRLWRSHQPYARDPLLSVQLDGDTERVSGWIASVDGVAQADRSVRLTPDGKVVR